MKNSKTVCMMVLFIMIGAGVVTSVNASEIDNGSIDVTINEGLWGTVSPIINIPNETSVTLNAVKINDSVYEVRDNLSIPLSITCDKQKVLGPKKLFTVFKARRELGDIKIKYSNIVPIYNGTIFYNGEIPDVLSAQASYNISDQTFSDGEKMTLTVLSIGFLPGEGEPHEIEYTLDELFDLIPERLRLFNGIFIRIFKEFFDAGFSIDLSSFPIFASKSIDLNISYILGEEEEPPEGYTLDVSVPNGNGTVQVSPDKDIYEEGTEVELTAVPGPVFVFNGWSGDITSSENPINIIMDGDKTITAHFKQTPVVINLRGGIGSATLTVTNQRDYDLADIDYNLTEVGGIFGKISSQENGTIDNITVNESVSLNTPKVMLGFGKSTITIELNIPGEGIIERGFLVRHIGPFVIPFLYRPF